MQIPFADALLSRLGRRETGLERLEEIEDEAAESGDAADLPLADPALLLQRMENRLIRHHLAEPEVLSDEELRKLRYILNFARLADFEPGAAGPGGRRGRGDVSVGADIAARDFDVVDAASFSAAIPGVLHHETTDPRMIPILDDLFEEEDIAALVDGGTASNVPIELAWKRVRDGRLGTRNACYLAFDCFHPQWDPRNLWLVPITQAIQLQMVRNLPYADHLVRFGPTLSPVNLAPSATSIDRASRWGHNSVDRAIPVTTALLQPTWWEGDSPPAAKPRTLPKSVASPMSAVMAAIQVPTSRLARLRDRYLT